MESYGISRSLHRFAVVTCLVTLALVGLGGLVTSHGVGMAVPDWPNTYGYNMFFFPVSQWVGGIFYEHSHRLLASGVGLLTMVLALWLHGRRARPLMRYGGGVLLVVALAILGLAPDRWSDALVIGVTGAASFGVSFFWPRAEPAPKWLRRLGLLAFGAVVLQGVLGGLRVTAIKDELGIFHAVLAQLFFCLTCALVLFTSRWWRARDEIRNPKSAIRSPETELSKKARRDRKEKPGFETSRLILGTTLLILVQLALGATMRHAHAGLAIPDFPLAYGSLWPDMSSDAVERYNQQRLEITAVEEITAGHIALQMAHRILAVVILLSVGWAAWSICRSYGFRHVLSRLALFWAGLILTQFFLGAWTVWSNKAADVATAHVLVGTLTLATGAIMCIIRFRLPSEADDSYGARVEAPVSPGQSMGIQTAAGS